jgi:hypothetical protein
VIRQLKVNYLKLNNQILIALMFIAGFAQSGEAITTKVVYAGVNSKNMVFVTFSDPLIQAGCDGKTQLVLPADSLIKDQVLSIALAAKATGSTVTIKPEGCLDNNPSLLNATSWGWFYMQ